MSTAPEQTGIVADELILVDGAEAGASRWSVHEFRWESIEPSLPHDLSELLAPPVVVAASGSSS
jgi:hypothetical protein